MSKKLAAILAGILSLAVIAGLICVGFNQNTVSAAAPEVSSETGELVIPETPQNVDEDGFIWIGYQLGNIVAVSPEAAVRANPFAPELKIILDYVCPHCYDFEAVNIDTIANMLINDEARFAFSVIALNPDANDGFSVRASAASVLVATVAPQSWFTFHNILFAVNPSQYGGLDDSQIAEVAEYAEVPAAVVQAIADGRAYEAYGQWVLNHSMSTVTNPSYQTSDGQFGTPAFIVNGEIDYSFPWTEEDGLRNALLSASNQSVVDAEE